MSDKTIWTIGHSTRPIMVFIDMLRSFDIQHVADIRAIAGSRRYPQFNKGRLIHSLYEHGIAYTHIPELGGRRTPHPHSQHTALRNDGFRGFADYMETTAFADATKALEEMATTERTACMCSEAAWRDCHRSLLSDHLTLHGWHVIHITGTGQSEPHHYTKSAQITAGTVKYPSIRLF